MQKPEGNISSREDTYQLNKFTFDRRRQLQQKYFHLKEADKNGRASHKATAS